MVRDLLWSCSTTFAVKRSRLIDALGTRGAFVGRKTVLPRAQARLMDVPADWRECLADAVASERWAQLCAFVASEREKAEVYPPPADVLRALELTPYEATRVLILGQDPYHGPDQAHGLSFSVPPGQPIPPSLRNIFRELEDDIGCKVPEHGLLQRWAEQGVLLLNAVLTVRAGEPNSHKNKGWEWFTDRVIEALDHKNDPVVFVFWGAYARKKGRLVDRTRHTIVESAHPSPLSQKRFLGTRPFSKINAALEASGLQPIDWCIPNKA